jgi:hypothetical protein
VMQTTGALANETLQEFGGSRANHAAPCEIVSLAQSGWGRPIRSVHAATAQQAQGNSDATRLSRPRTRWPGRTPMNARSGPSDEPRLRLHVDARIDLSEQVR